MAISTLSKKISILKQISKELREGKNFNITRLTSLKSLCSDSQAAAQFCLYLAYLTFEKMEQKVNLYHQDEIWSVYKDISRTAISKMVTYISNPIKENEQALWSIRSKVRDINNQYENQSWGPVRIIQCKEVLLIEEAIDGILYPSQSSYWGYQIARSYAERYDSRYGTGLVSESAPMIEDIVNFWSQYHAGSSLNDWIEGQLRRVRE